MSLNTRIRTSSITVSRVTKRWGFDPLAAVLCARGTAWVRADRQEYERQRLASTDPTAFTLGPPYPVFWDRGDQAGSARGHYFHQDLLVAREIFERQPRRHIDVGSRIDGFVAHVASFRDVEVLDVRPLDSAVRGITPIQHDLMALDPTYYAIADSVSCLHALEHFGLGRYGDRVDYDGWRKGLVALTAMLEPDGLLYLGVPTGEPQRVEFNAHRVFSLPFLRDILEHHFEIQRLAFVTDAGDLIPTLDPHGPGADRSFDAAYGCSIWVLRKR